MLVKCWKVDHWNAKKFPKNCQKSKKFLPKFQKLPPKFLDNFYINVNLKLYFSFFTVVTNIGQEKKIYIDLARAKIEALVNNTYKQKKLNRVMLNGDGNENGIKINRSN